MKSFVTLTFLFLISSCGGGGSSGSIDQDLSTPEDDVVSEVCANTSIQNLQKCDLKHDNLNRYYYVYKPDNLDINQSIPVLFALHGYGSSASRHLG